MCTCFLMFLTAEAFLLCVDCYLGNREMSQSVPKQKKKAPQYKGQKKSKLRMCWLALFLFKLLLFLFLFLPPAALLVKTLCSVVCRAAGSLRRGGLNARPAHVVRSVGASVQVFECKRAMSWVHGFRSQKQMPNWCSVTETKKHFVLKLATAMNAAGLRENTAEITFLVCC